MQLPVQAPPPHSLLLSALAWIGLRQHMAVHSPGRYEGEAAKQVKHLWDIGKATEPKDTNPVGESRKEKGIFPPRLLPDYLLGSNSTAVSSPLLQKGLHSKHCDKPLCDFNR